MKKKQSGFTLLETIIALFLFTMLLSSLWGFFTNTYKNYMRFQQKNILMNNARSTSNFIKESIRTGEDITINLESGMIDSSVTSEVTGSLQKIELVADGSKKLVLKLNGIQDPAYPSDSTKRIIPKGKGLYTLVYRSNGVDSVISELIQNINVIKKANSNLVEFTCQFNQYGEMDEVLKLEQHFLEVLAYK